MIREVNLPDGSLCFRMTRKDAQILEILCEWDGINKTAELKQALRTRYEKRLAERQGLFRKRNTTEGKAKDGHEQAG